jgi:hypothetical protein
MMNAYVEILWSVADGAAEMQDEAYRAYADLPMGSHAAKVAWDQYQFYRRQATLAWRRAEEEASS